MEVNDKAPEFSLANEEGKQPSALKDYRGKNVVLVLLSQGQHARLNDGSVRVPRRIQARSSKAGAVVFGISADKPSAQKKFKEKYDLPYSLLADVDKAVCKKFGVTEGKEHVRQEIHGN